MDLSAFPALPPCMRDCQVVGIALTGDVLQAGNSPIHGRDHLYTLWKTKRSPEQRPFYIVTPGDSVMELGDHDLYLSPLPDLDLLREEGTPGHFELPALLTMCKEQGIAVKAPVEDESGKTVQVLREPEELVNELEKLHEDTGGAIFYRRIPPYPPEVLLGFGEDLSSALELALRGGWRVDEDLVFLFKAHLPTVEPSTIPPEVAMRSAPHEILVTGTKPGKTHISRRLGLNIERPTAAGLLGYATADKREYGHVHGSRATIFVDEVAQEPREEVASFLPTYLEMGEVHIARGIKIRVRGHAPVVFMSNPRQDEVYDPLQSFVGVLRALTLTNPLGLGSRTGAAYFNPGTEPAGNELHVDREGMERLRALITSFQFHTASLLSAALQDPKAERWLEEGFPKSHLRLLDRAIDEVRLPEIRYFLTGYRDSYRHARGIALRVAFVDTAHLHLEAGEVQVQALLLRAKAIWPTVLSLREASLHRLVRVAGDVEMVRRALAARFGGFHREYLRRGLVAIAAWWKERQEAKEEILKGIPFPFEDTRDSYLATPAYDRSLRQATFPYILDVLERNLNDADAAFRPFGFRVAVGSFGLEFAVVSQETFKIAMEVVAVEVGEEPVHPSATDDSGVGNGRIEDEKESSEESGDGRDGRDGEGGSGTPPHFTKERTAGDGTLQSKGRQGTAEATPRDGTLQSKGRQGTAGVDPDLGTKQGSAVPAVPAVPGSLWEGVVSDSLREDVLRAIKTGDRGYGVPRTAIAHRIAQDLGIELRRMERLVEEPLMDLLTEGELVEPRSGVFRLSKGEGS